VLLLINTTFFSLPGFPGSLSKITEQAPEQNPPDVKMFYSPNEVCEFLKAIWPEGRQAFQIMHLTIDLSFPLLYGMLFFILIKHLASRLSKSFEPLPWLGLLTAVMDLAENLSHVFITNQFPSCKPNLVKVAQIFTISKFSLIIICLSLIGYLTLRNYLIKRKQKIQFSND